MNEEPNAKYAFSCSVQGFNHKANHIPCEDASSSYVSDSGATVIAVADGHGSKEFVRAKEGARIATEVTQKTLTDFAKLLEDSSEMEESFLTDPRYRKGVLKQLTDTIIANWSDEVLAHYRNHPLESVETLDVGGTLRLYGTTLLAALMLPKAIVLFHQGDGRCVVINENGQAGQPVPWDKRCVGNVTTSLCDSDATLSIRSLVIDLSESPVLAVLLGSDGVDDTYTDSETSGDGIHAFFKNLLLDLLKEGTSDFEQNLPAKLSDFSAFGKFSESFSGDDVSVAGIVDVDLLKDRENRISRDVRIYELKSEWESCENKLNSMRRKRDFLKKTAEDSKKALLEKIDEKKSLRSKLKDFELLILKTEFEAEDVLKRLKTYSETPEEFTQRVADLLDIMEENNLSSAVIICVLELLRSSPGIKNQVFFFISQKREHLRRKYKSLKDLYQTQKKDFRVLSQDFTLLRNELEAYRNKFKRDILTYAEYEQKFQKLRDRKKLILDEIQSLSGDDGQTDDCVQWY